jgi:hypothetical protein
MDFFSATSDKNINTIKKELFNVADGNRWSRLPCRARDDGSSCSCEERRHMYATFPCTRRHRATCTHARACMRVRACALCTHAHGAGGRAGGSVDGARCALITYAVCPGDFVLFETLKDVQSDRTTCLGSLASL